MSHNKSTPESHPVLAARRRGRYAVDNRGFTIVELILVAAILAIITLLAIPAYDQIKDRVRVARATEEIRGIEKSITAWSIDRGGTLPEHLTDSGLNLGFKDPWGRDYEYHPKTETSYPGRYLLLDMAQLNGDYDLFSTGANGSTWEDIADTRAQDDILRVSDGIWVGLVGKITGEMF